MVYYSRTREYCTPSIRFNSLALKLPVHKVGRCGMSPCHVLPLRAIGIKLVVKMPYTILIEHAVRVVHPSISWSVMIYGTILLAVGHVEWVGILHILPACEARNTTIVTIGAIDMNVERKTFAILELIKIERHKIVDVIGCEANIQSFHLIIAIHNLDIAHLSLLLHWQEQNFLWVVHTIDAVVATEKTCLLRWGWHCKP